MLDPVVLEKLDLLALGEFFVGLDAGQTGPEASMRAASLGDGARAPRP